MLKAVFCLFMGSTLAQHDAVTSKNFPLTQVGMDPVVR